MNVHSTFNLFCCSCYREGDVSEIEWQNKLVQKRNDKFARILTYSEIIEMKTNRIKLHNLLIKHFESDFDQQFANIKQQCQQVLPSSQVFLQHENQDVQKENDGDDVDSKLNDSSGMYDDNNNDNDNGNDTNGDTEKKNEMIDEILLDLEQAYGNEYFITREYKSRLYPSRKSQHTNKKKIDDEFIMIDYLHWKSNFESKRIQKESIKRKGNTRCIMNWNWLQLSKWIEKLDGISYFGAVFAEFQINPIELILFDSLHIDALCLLSEAFQNLQNNKRRKSVYDANRLKCDFELLCLEIRKYRIQVVFEMVYQKIWSHVIRFSQTKGEKSKSKHNNNENNENNMKNSDNTSDNYKNINIMSKKETIEEMARLIVEITSKFRGKSEDGIQMFWKDDAIFFNKIDNICALLLMPKKFQGAFNTYFPNYFSDGDETEIRPSITSVDINKLDKSNSSSNINTRQMSSLSSVSSDSRLHSNHLVLVQEILLANMELKTYYYNGRTYEDCVTAADIAQCIRKLNMFSDQEIIELVNELLIQHWLVRLEGFNPANNYNNIVIKPAQELEENTKQHPLITLNETQQQTLKTATTTSSKRTVIAQFSDRGAHFYSFSNLTRLSGAGIHVHGSSGRSKNVRVDENTYEKHANRISKLRSPRGGSFHFIENTCPFMDKHCFKEVFWQPIGCTLVGLIAISICLIVFWYDQAIWQIDQAMHLTRQSVEQTFLNDLELVFSIPQSVLQVMIGGIIINDIIVKNGTVSLSNNDPTDKTYEFLESMPLYDPLGALSDVYVYNVNDSTLKGAYMEGGESNIYFYNGSCLVSETAGVVSCNYNPLTRDWYNLSLSLGKNGRLTREWTNVYQFARGGLGMSLVENLQYDGYNYVVVVEYTAQSIERIAESLLIPLDGVLYITNEELSVITSSVGEIDLIDCNSDEYSNNDCTAENSLLKESIDIIRDMEQDGSLEAALNKTSDGYVHTKISWDSNFATIGKFDVCWTVNGSQEFYLVLAYSDAYLDDINQTTNFCLICSGIVVIFGILLLICIQFADSRIQLQNVESNKKTFSWHNSGIKKKWKSIKNKTLEFFVSLKNDSHSLQLMTKVSKIVLIVGLVAIYAMITYAKQVSYDRLIEGTLLKEEFNQVYTPVSFILQNHSDTILDMIEERIQLNKMPNYQSDPFRGIDDVLIFDENDFSFDNISWEGTFNDSIFNNINNFTYASSIDKYFTNLMFSFMNNDLDFLQYSVYFATPNGSIYGATTLNSTSEGTLDEVLVMRRDPTTNWIYKTFFATGDGYGSTEESDEFIWYDPRCRDWYLSAIQYTFTGNIFQAFPLSSHDLEAYFNGDSISAETTECTDAKNVYYNLFDVDTSIGNHNTTTTMNLFNTSNKTITKQTDGAWARYVFAGGDTGIAISKAIVNETTGDLLGVVSIDYTLNGVSDILANSNDEPDWDAWIFEANSTDMVASSDGLVLTSIDGLDGLVCVDDSTDLIPYEVLEHPNPVISIASELIIDVTGIDELPINYTGTGLLSKTIATILSAPHIEAARIRYWPGNIGSYGVDYIVVKAIDLRDFEQDISEIKTMIFVISGAILIICFYAIERIERWVVKQLKEESMQEIDARYNIRAELKTPIIRTIYDVKDDLYNMIIDRACHEWNRYLEIRHLSGEKDVITMQHVKEFASASAKQYLEAKDNDNTLTDKMQLCDEACIISDAMIAESTYVLLFDILPSYSYNVFIETVVIIHILTAFREPETPHLLMIHGWTIELICIVGICIIIEWIDLLLSFYSRWTRCAIRCNANKYIRECERIQSNDATTGESLSDDNGSNSAGIRYKYNEQTIDDLAFFWRTDSNFLRVLFGPGSKRFNSLVIINFFILINFIGTVSFRVGYFSYYMPIVPCLFMFRHQATYFAIVDTLTALKGATDVLLLFCTLWVVLGCFGAALFKDFLNVDGIINNYTTMSESLVTSFLFMSTGTFIFTPVHYSHYIHEI